MAKAPSHIHENIYAVVTAPHRTTPQQILFWESLCTHTPLWGKSTIN